MDQGVRSLKCFDVANWRKYGPREMVAYLERLRARNGQAADAPIFKSTLIFRRYLRPVDVYSYLKARFGEPNGMQTQLARKDTSDNLFHWDFNLKAADEDVYVSGTNREVHFMTSEALSDEDWPKLLANLKEDFGRVSKKKAQILNSFERWVIFPNRYVQTAEICAELHKELSSILKSPSFVKMDTISASRFKEILINDPKKSKALVKRTTSLFRLCLELSLLTPVLAEAFINMTVLILCKKEIKENKRQFDAFIRSHIDVKISDLPYKCNGFAKKINSETPGLKEFQAIMNKRNDTIHGNMDPELEQLESLYFERKKPLFKEPGDHLLKYFQSLERQLDPVAVIRNYESVQGFFLSIGECLDPEIKDSFWRIMETTYPGYDLDRKIAGVLLPDVTTSNYLSDARYDDELPVKW